MKPAQNRKRLKPHKRRPDHLHPRPRRPQTRRRPQGEPPGTQEPQERADVVRNLGDVPTRNSLLVVRTLEARANLLRVGNVVEEAALDKYTFTRDVFLQRRRNAVYDGDPPQVEKPEGR